MPDNCIKKNYYGDLIVSDLQALASNQILLDALRNHILFIYEKA